MIFDITSEKTSKNFLIDFLKIEEKQIDDFIRTTTDFIYVDEFLEYINESLDDKDISNLSLSLIHITSNDDECQSIKELGLLNLQGALSMDTPLNSYLKKHHIEFDISSNLMCIKGGFYELVYDPLRYESETLKGKINNVARKIYSDYEIKGFFCVRDSKKYDSDVNLRPEIIGDISKLGKNPDEFESVWVGKSKPYMIKFNLPIEYFAYYSFYLGVQAFKDDYLKKINLKKWLVSQAITVIWEKYHYGKLPKEIIGYLKSEVVAGPKYISTIKQI